MQRRKFIQQLGATGLLLGSGITPGLARQFNLLSAASEAAKLTILHTNDWHSRIDPFPESNRRNAGQGGAVRRARKIETIRNEAEHVLLLDAGDIFQGTPYFNLFGGELELKLMSKMGYDLATIGNHDFDLGIEHLADFAKQHAQFGFVNANYELKDTPLAGMVRPYQIFEKGPLKIGVLGVGIELEGLVPTSLYGDAQYNDPLAAAERYGQLLKEEEKCDLVICLSHLGYRYREEKVSDMILAQETRHIDIILGGHTHTFLDEPTIVKNKADRGVLVHQVGFGGLILGRIDVSFSEEKGKPCFSCANTWLE